MIMSKIFNLNKYTFIFHAMKKKIRNGEITVTASAPASFIVLHICKIQ